MMTKERANRIYDVLTELCAAPAGVREAFVAEMTSPQPTSEFRFCGNLGFGGKYYIDRNRVAGDGDAIVKATNARLATIPIDDVGLELSTVILLKPDPIPPMPERQPEPWRQRGRRKW